MNRSNSSVSNSFRDEDDEDDRINSQLFQTMDSNSSASLDISRLDIHEPVNEFAKRITQYFGQIQKFKANFENNRTRTKNEEDCVKFCEELINEHIKSLDQMNDCINERNSANALLDETQHRIKDLERALWYEKESKSDLKKKFEEDDQQNQDEVIKKERFISILQTKLKKLEQERKQIYDEKQDLLVQYQNDQAKYEKERFSLQKMYKKLTNERELDELEFLNYKNSLINMTHELCGLFNLASEYRGRGAFFGKQFLNTYELVFGKLKFNNSNVTFLEMPNESVSFNSSSLHLKEITSDELNNFNIVLKEKLIQNEDELTIDQETFINNSGLLVSSNYEFENRLLGNETYTFKKASLIDSSSRSAIPVGFIDNLAKDIMNGVIVEHAKQIIAKSWIELTDDNWNQQNLTCNDQIKFMFKPNRSTANESFQESYNRFEESFTENLVKTCVSSDEPEVLGDILNYKKNVSKKELSRNYSQQIDSKIMSTKFDENGKQVQQTDRQTMVQSMEDQDDKNSSLIISTVTESTYQNHSEIRSKQWNSLNETINMTDRSNSLNRSDSESSCETDTTELMVTLADTEIINQKKYNSRSDGESVGESNENGSSTGDSYSNDSDVHSMQLTNINNLSNVFNELSGNQKLNSTVKVDEQLFSSQIEVNNAKEKDDLNPANCSDMQLSEDYVPTESSSKDDENDSEPLIVDLMLSGEANPYDLSGFYNTIRQESNHSITNMDLSNSIENQSSKSTNSLSVSAIVDKLNDEYVSNSKRRIRKRKSTWSPYFSPILSLLSLFYPIFILCKYIFLVTIFFVGFGIYFLCHFHALKIYYTSWQEIGSNFLNIYFD